MGASADRLTVTEIVYGLQAAGYSDDGSREPRRYLVQSAVNTGNIPPISHDDAAQIALLKSGDQRALKHLYLAYYTSLHVIAASMTGSEASAEEVVNDVFESLWSIRDTWNPTYGIRAYLIRAVRNRARNFIRAERSQVQMISHAVAGAIPGEVPGMGVREQSIDEKLDADELATIVWGVVGKLPEPTQLILTLRWKHGLTWNAIAHAMNMNAGAVQMQHNRACKLLRQRLPKHLR